MRALIVAIAPGSDKAAVGESTDRVGKLIFLRGSVDEKLIARRCPVGIEDAGMGVKVAAAHEKCAQSVPATA
jgi:hypothetical protein